MVKRRWSGTARRLAFGFGALVALYAGASSFALFGFREIHRGLERTQARMESLKVALDLSSAVRDQYAHEAHTIIIGNETHLGFHEQAKARVLELVTDIRGRAEREDERRWVDEIEGATSDLDTIFQQKIVPAVLAGRHEEVQAEHANALAVVSRIQERTDRLARRFQEAQDEFQAFVLGVEARAVRWGLVFLLLAPLCAAALGLYIGRSVARPVARLQEGAERLAAGDLGTWIEIDSEDEFGTLARQFNAMTQSIKSQQAELVQRERLATIGGLAAGVAHEINNPLGVILGYVQLLRKKAEPGLAEDLAVVEEEALRCKEIVEGLLDLARPQRSENCPVDLREVCDGVAARLSESRETGARVHVSGQAVTQGDARKLRQVVFNLVKNGLEAAGDGGRVEVTVSKAGVGVAVEVRDFGPGIEPASLSHLFEPFFTTKKKGTGLGLAVSQAIARAHGGQIDVDPTAGPGACFTLKLPAATPKRAP